MRKRIFKMFTLLIVVISLLGILPTVTVSADDNVIYNKLMALKSKFPDGKYWNHYVSSTYDYADYLGSQSDGERFSDSVTSSPCATHTTAMNLIGKYDCNYFDGGMQCFGFAGKIFYEVFNQRKSQIAARTDIYNIRIGDYVRINNNTHSGVVLSRNGNQITLVECNLDQSGQAYNCKIRWGWSYNISSVNYFIHATNYDQVANVHTHSYSSSVTKQPTCTSTGVRTFTCSCGSSYTETIPATGHKYTTTVIAPTTTEKGYTLHKCSVCGDSYKDNYINPPTLGSDGWYYCNALPSDVASDKYTIEYNNYYEKIQKTSPGSDWKNAGVVKNEWQNSGSQYKSATDLPTSDSRVLVSSIYYHFCIPGAGINSEGNYEMSGNFQHYDYIPASWVTSQYLGDDNGHPYYFLYWSTGEMVYCKTGDTCDGTWGTHSARCRAWYKENTYQDRVKVELYKFTKNSDWISSRDSNASSVEIRYKSNSVKVNGDVNDDRKITIDDVTLIQKYLANMSELDSTQLKVADVNNDGDISIDDVTMMQKYIAGAITKLG